MFSDLRPSIERRHRTFYDKGFRSESYDLVILEVFDLPAAVALMRAIRPTLVEPTYEYGTVWRIPVDLSDEQISDRLSALPTVFPDMHLFGASQSIAADRYMAFPFGPDPRTRRFAPLSSSTTPGL